MSLKKYIRDGRSPIPEKEITSKIMSRIKGKNMKKKIYQIQISLKGFRPKIWRRILVPLDILLPDLHKIIQTVMGWTNSHLHQFIKNSKFYSLPYEDNWDELPINDYRKIKGLMRNHGRKT